MHKGRELERYIAQLGILDETRVNINANGKLVREFVPLRQETFNLLELAIALRELLGNMVALSKPNFPAPFLSTPGKPLTFHLKENKEFNGLQVWSSENPPINKPS